MSKDDTYPLVVYEQDWDVKSDRLARTFGTKLISDDLGMMFRFSGGPAQDWGWKNERPEQRGRTYIVDTDAEGLNDDAELINLEGDNAKVSAEQGVWNTRTKAKRYREIVSLTIFSALMLVLVYMGYIEYTRTTDLAGFIVRQQREIEAAEEAAERRGREAQQVIINAPAIDPAADGLQALPMPEITPVIPTPVPTPVVIEDFS